MNINKLAYDKNIVMELKQILGEYSFYLPDILEVEIKIKLYRYIDREDICFKTNYFIQTPTQIGPYVTSHNFAPTEEIALEMAIKTITRYYNNALAEGYKPKIDWLIKNSYY